MNWILEKVKSAENIEELLTTENDSELLLQLSHMRRNLIEWIPLPSDGTVLEIGAGCGVITGLLAERCNRVVAVENQQEYLEVNRYLNREKENIEYCLSLKESDVNSLKNGSSEFTNFEIGDSKNCGFDIVVLLGLSECAEKFGMSAKELLDYSASRLAPTGCLILAMDNKYALKFWAGMKSESAANCFNTMAGSSQEMTYAQVERQLMEAGLSSVKCFYPTPDYRLPIEIFSESYPVKAGSITENTRDYNQTRYQVFDEPLVADELCRDGMYAQFANSYLVIAEAAPEQKELDKILYTKYNSIRDAKFQLRTSILEEDGKRLVSKAPMVGAAKAHLNQMEENRNLLGKVYENIKPVDFIEKDDALYFTFVKGQPILKLSEEKGASLESLVSKIKDALSIIFDVKQEICVPFTMTEDFGKMYPGCVPAEGVPTFAISNLDSIVSNFVRTEQGEIFCLDYEWVANFPIPVNYVKYRSLLYIYRENHGIFASLIGRDEFFHEFEICDEEITLFDKMESAFQQYVHGKGLKYNYLKRYEKLSVSWEDLIGNGATERIEEYEKQLSDKDVHIDNLTKAGEQKDKMIASLGEKVSQTTAHLFSAQLQMQAQKDYIDKIAYYKNKPIRAAIDRLTKKRLKNRIDKLYASEQNTSHKSAANSPEHNEGCSRTTVSESLEAYNSEIRLSQKLWPDFESHLNVDRLECSNSMLVFEGWSVDELCEDNRATERLVLLERVENGKIVKTRAFDTFAVRRLDVADCYPNRYDLEDAGFCCRIPKEMLRAGDYYVSLVSVQNSKNLSCESENKKNVDEAGSGSRRKNCTAKKHRVAWMITIS